MSERLGGSMIDGCAENQDGSYGVAAQHRIFGADKGRHECAMTVQATWSRVTWTGLRFDQHGRDAVGRSS